MPLRRSLILFQLKQIENSILGSDYYNRSDQNNYDRKTLKYLLYRLLEIILKAEFINM